MPPKYEFEEFGDRFLTKVPDNRFPVYVRIKCTNSFNWGWQARKDQSRPHNESCHIN